MKIAKLFLLAVFVIGFSGCSGKIKQCNDLIGVINKGQEILTKTKGAENPDSKHFTMIADELDKFKANIGKVSLKDEKLQGFAKEYQELIEELAGALRETAKAMDSDNADDKVKALNALTAVSGKEGPITNKINEYCQAP